MRSKQIHNISEIQEKGIYLIQTVKPVNNKSEITISLCNSNTKTSSDNLGGIYFNDFIWLAGEAPDDTKWMMLPSELNTGFEVFEINKQKYPEYFL